MKVFDCFSGFGGDPAHSDHGGWGNAARARGHEVGRVPTVARAARTNKRPQQFATMPNGQTWVIDQTTGEPCHERAERGAKTGIQGLKDAADRAIIPSKLAEMILDACEHDLGEQAPPPAGRLFA